VALQQSVFYAFDANFKQKYNVPVAAPPTEKEKREVGYYLKLRDEIHQGPLYTKSSNPNKPTKTYGEDQVNSQYDSRSKADIDPFVGVPTYSKKYEPKARTIPQLSGPFSESPIYIMICAIKLK
jgi:DNA-directed RNA polymerase III subunit RPC7